ncbi:extensin family protein [Hoeflea sp. BAL378]|uniref:extensin-like domain-containing protein n=1 Tax=Hoeflea sp. BAL378 TaxID=1547437 RepID=UPI0009DD803B|nr:extensin family protein [Hoeflea sp. BAL378]
MTSRVAAYRRPRGFPVALALTAALVAGCSGDMSPPGDLLAIEPSNPVIRADPVQPMMSAPVETAMFSETQSSPIPDDPGAPLQNVLAYPVADGVDSMQMTSALPEGNVDQPVVTGIGTDAPSLASAPVAAAPDPRTVDLEDRPVVVEQQPVLLAGAMTRAENPMSTPKWAGGLPAAEKACRQRLKRLGVTFRDIPAIGNGTSCSIPYPIELTKLSGGIQIKPAAKLNCQITEAFAQWVKNELGPAARVRYLSGVRSINQLSSYSCRTMNSKRGAPMSEHAKGNAIDVGKITLDNGRAILVKQPGLFAFRQKSLLNSIRADSCKYFTTVLGPGSDVHHKDHFHFDLRTRKTAYRHCD